MENIILQKSYHFAVRSAKLSQHLQKTHSEYIISRQFLKAGTSIGANITEAQQAQSRADFLSKMNIALKEAGEAQYWLNILKDSNYLTLREFNSIYSDCTEIVRILSAIVKTTKNA